MIDFRTAVETAAKMKPEIQVSFHPATGEVFANWGDIDGFFLDEVTQDDIDSLAAVFGRRFTISRWARETLITIYDMEWVEKGRIFTAHTEKLPASRAAFIAIIEAEVKRRGQ